MKIEFKTLEPSYIVGFPSLVNIAKVQETVPTLWNKMNECIKDIKNLTSPPQCIGFEYYPFDFKNTGLFYYMPAYLVKDLNDIPMNMCGKSIPGGLHAVFTHKGSIVTISESFKYIYHDWLVNNNEYELASNYDFEFYDNRFMAMSDESELEIWIPVKKKA